MENSFFYFFSATPQVLGAVLALFGVFVVFKLQSLKTLLIDIAKDVVKVLDHFQPNKVDIDKIYKAIDENKMEDLYKTISILSDGFFAIELNLTAPLGTIINYGNNKVRFVTLYFIYRNIIDTTITTTIFTVVIIVTCLAMLPFVHILKDCPIILYSICGIVIICIIYILVRLIYVLKKAIK